MAVMLKNGTRATNTTTTLPIRSCTIHIAQTGLIERVVDQSNEPLQIVNLGFQGDDLVTRVKVQLWKNAENFKSVGYEAAMVFYNESTKSRQTLTMSTAGTYFFVDIPESVTKDGGMYQLYFILRENVDTTKGGGGSGAIGVEDDPVYREVFVSDVRRGIVDANSGYSLIPNFDWETQVYNYNLGALHSSDWEENGDAYLTQIYLAGAKKEDGSDVELSDIEIRLPDKVEPADYEDQPDSWKNYTNKTLSIRVKTSNEDIDILEKIEVVYPVEFIIDDSKNIAQKTPIKVQHTASQVSVTDNSYLGMKHDAYITPIDLSGLISLLGNSDEAKRTKKYTIFSQNDVVYVCEAFDNKCWIPIGVTSVPGLWSISFVGKATDGDTEYTYYTGILKLEVKDNILTKKDVNGTSVYQAIIDSGNNYLVDVNNFVLYAINDDPSTVKIDYTGATIDRAIGWVVGLIQEGFDEQSIIENISKLDTINETINTIITDLDSVEQIVNDANLPQVVIDVESLKAKDVEVDTAINEIQKTLDNLDMGTIPTRVESLESNVTKHSEQISENKTNITNLQNRTAELAVEISTERGRVNNLELKDITIQQQIDVINATIDPYKNYSDLISGEIENRTLGDERLQQQINTHTDSINGLGQSINELNVALSAESATRANKDTQIDENITSINNNIDIINSEINNVEAGLQANINRVDAHQTTITALEANTIKTHTEDVVYVAKIKFLSSIEEYQTLADAGQLDAKTLYLIQEEE